ncbi:putative retrotransposon hobase, partial [Fusarium acutatum]
LQALLNSEQLDQVMDPVQGPDEQEMTETSLENAVEELPTGEAEPEEGEAAEAQEYTQSHFEVLPTPPNSPPSSFLTQIGIQTSQEKDQAIGSEANLYILN